MLFDSDRLDNIVGRAKKNEIVSLSIKKMGGGFDSVSATRENFYTQRNRSGGEKRMDLVKMPPVQCLCRLTQISLRWWFLVPIFFSLCIQGWLVQIWRFANRLFFSLNAAKKVFKCSDAIPVWKTLASPLSFLLIWGHSSSFFSLHRL